MNVKNYLKCEVCQKKEEQRLFFSSFLDIESSEVWAGSWHYLKKLLANSIYSSHVPFGVQDNSVCLDVAERFSSAIIDGLFGATLNPLVSVSAGKWSWNRSLSLVSSFHIFLCPTRVCEWFDGLWKFSFLFSFCFWLYIVHMPASIERLFLGFFFRRSYARLSMSFIKASCAANFWFRLIWIRLIQEPF